jgi:hypothetical protein
MTCKSIKIDDVEYIRKDQAKPPDMDGEPPYFGVMLVETVTKYFIGEVVGVYPQEIVLRDACWVACTGRYHQFLASGDGGQSTELEPCPDGHMIIGRGSIVNAQPYSGGLVRVAK